MPFTAAAVSEEITSAVKVLVKASPGLSVKERLRTLARHIGLPVGRVADYWYGEVRCPPAHEADLIRAYYKAADELVNAKAEHEKRFSDFIRNHPNLAFLVPGSDQNRSTKTQDASFMAHKAKAKSIRAVRRAAS